MFVTHNVYFFIFFSDEHSLIAQYCQKLHNGDFTTIVPDSPMQMMEEINREQTHELELMIRCAGKINILKNNPALEFWREN